MFDDDDDDEMMMMMKRFKERKLRKICSGVNMVKVLASSL